MKQFRVSQGDLSRIAAHFGNIVPAVPADPIGNGPGSDMACEGTTAVRSGRPLAIPARGPRGVARRAGASLLLAAGCMLAPYVVQAQVVRPPDNVYRDETPDADAAIASGKLQKAITDLDKRIASHPRDVQARFKRATLLAELGRDDDAIKALTQITQTYPELPEPYNNLAALYAKHGRFQEARATLETALAANPNFSLARRNLGDIYLRLAADAYARAVQQNPSDRLADARLNEVRAIITRTPANSEALAQPRPDRAPPQRHTTAQPPNAREFVPSMGGQPPTILPENQSNGSTTNNGNTGY
ncbi:tetratricopeptide repeat protein [Robbsia andropogonis]|uniref:tetratricopeptide repeat protein n=1 Tax=Robbsia andropogonis TaxID=28092 RepID=UPI0006983633